jgi:YHS domain-containing protein
VSDLGELERQIEQRLAGAKAKHVLYQGHNRERMQDMDREQRQREQVASRSRELAESLIRPRMARLATYFDNAEALPPSQTGEESCVCSFRHTERFPATAKLTLTAHPDAENARICVTYRLEILPIFFEFDHEDQLELSADAVDVQAANSWVERKILQFLDTYLKLQELDPYQQENLVTDPVCGMRINRTSAAAQMEHGGRTFYFCVGECRDKFAAEPSQFVSLPT